MAVRAATRRYSDLPSFLADYQSTLRVGALLLPPGAIDGEPAPEMKIDLAIPLVGRIGPIVAQVVQQLPDGSVALRVPELPPQVAAAVKNIQDAVADLKRWLIETGELSLPAGAMAAEIERLRAQVKELESRPAGPAVATVAIGTSTAAVASPDRVRGLAVPDVSQLPPNATGLLGDRTMRDTFMRIAVARSTGLLTLKLPNGSFKWGFFTKGGVVGWRTEPVDETEVMGVLLFRANQLTKEQLAESLQRMDTTGQRQGEVLIDMGVFGFAQLVMVLQKQAEFVLQRVLALKAGEWAWHELAELPERFVNPPIRVAAMLYRQMKAAAKEMPAEDLAMALRPWLDRYVYFQPGADKVLDEMRLSVEEQQFVKITGSTSYRLRELFTVSNLSRSATAGTMWCLADLGLVEFRDEEATARGEERLARMIADRKAAATLNYFDRLDVHWICTGPEVEAAFQKLIVDFTPDKVAIAGEKHRAAMEKIASSLREAYETLRDDTKRREYRASVIEGPMIVQSAMMLAEKGDMAFMKDGHREALYCYSKAAELVPGNGRYKEGLTRAKAMRP